MIDEMKMDEMKIDGTNRGQLHYATIVRLGLVPA